MKPDYPLGTTIYHQFTTRNFSTGVPFALAGTPAISVREQGNATPITAGITLTASIMSVTGLNEVEIVATSGNGYESGKEYAAYISTGTVNSVSVVGEVIFTFSIEKQSALRPTTSGRTLDVSAGGEAGIDWANVGSPTTMLNLSGTSTKALEPTTAGRTLDVTATGAAGVDWGNLENATTANALTGTTISTAQQVDVRKINNTAVTGTGTSGDLWRG